MTFKPLSERLVCLFFSKVRDCVRTWHRNDVVGLMRNGRVVTPRDARTTRDVTVTTETGMTTRNRTTLLSSSQMMPFLIDNLLFLSATIHGCCDHDSCRLAYPALDQANSSRACFPSARLAAIVENLI